MPDITIPGNNLQSLVNGTIFVVGIVRVPNFHLVDYQTIDYFQTILTNVISIKITHSIDSYFRTCEMIISNRSLFRYNTPLTGNEIISIKYKNALYTNDSNIEYKNIHFRILKVKEIDNPQEASSNPGSSFISLQLVEFPAFDYFAYNDIYYTQGGNLPVSQIVKNLLNSIPTLQKHYELQIGDSPTNYLMNYWSPSWTMIKNLNYLKQFLISKESNPYWVFNIISGKKDRMKPIIRFNSIYDFLNHKAGRTYSSVHSEVYFRPTNTDSGVNFSGTDGSKDFSYEPLEVIDNKEIEWGDAMKFLNGFNGRTFVVNDSKKGCRYIPTNLDNYYKNNVKAIGRFGTTPEVVKFGNNWSSLSHLPYDNQDMVDAYIKNRMAKAIFKQMFLTVKTAVNQTREVGEKSNVILPLPLRKQEQKDDDMMGGNWLTWQIDDYIVANGTSFSKVTFCRDSFWMMNDKDKYLQKLPSFEDII